MNKGSIVEAVLQCIDRTWSGRLEPLYKLSTLLFLCKTLAGNMFHGHWCMMAPITDPVYNNNH